MFQQSGGSNTANYLSIGRYGRYVQSGGTLSLINGSLVNQGTFDGGGGTGSLIASSAIVNLSQGAVQNTCSMSISIDSNSLLIVPAGFSLADGFGMLNSQGITHNAGTTLVVPAGKGFSLSLATNDPVSCQGTILAPSGGSISLGNGLALSGTGLVGLGSGTLTVNDPISGITSGSLSAATQSIGARGAGVFTQSGGSSKLTNLYVDNGTYNLSGNATLSATYEYVANGGPAYFIQSGGTHSIAKSLYVGSAGAGNYTMSGGQLSAGTINLGSYSSPGTMSQSESASVIAAVISMEGGTYNLTDSGLLSAGSLTIGGDFSQSGGKVAIGTSLTLGRGSAGDRNLYGTYSLSGNAQLSASNIYVGSGSITGEFTQSGGTNAVGNLNIAGDYNQGVYNYGYGSSYTLGGNSLLSASNTYVAGSFIQSGGTHNVASNLYIGALEAGNSSSYTLSGNGLLAANNLYLTGTFMQSGGTHAIKTNLYIGYYGPNSYFGLSGNALLSASNVYVGYSQGGLSTMTIDGNSLLSAKNLYLGQNGAGAVTQSSGTVMVATSLGVGSFTQSGAYNLNGGLLSAGTLTVNGGVATSFAQSGGTAVILGTLNLYSSTAYNLNGIGRLSSGNMTISGVRATFSQFGGANAISGSLNISSGTYSLGSGLLSAATVSIGAPNSPATFSQSGGSSSAGLVLVGSNGRFVIGGGLLSVNGGLTNQGVFDGGGGSASIAATNSIVDFSTGTLQNIGAMSLSVGPNSLIMVPAGFNPYAAFGSFSVQGILHYAGTPLVLAANQGFAGQGSINDPVIGEGTIAASASGGINLNDGLYLSGTGNVNLGSGSLTVLDSASGMKGGLLQVNNLYVVGNASPPTPGVFTQSGGTDVVTGSLNLGGGSNGIYNLNGGILVLSKLTSNNSGSASFNLNGGMLRAGTSFATSVPLTLGISHGNATINSQGYAVTLSGSLSGLGNLIKNGSGKLILLGTNTYTGGTTVTDGTLIVTQPQALASGSDLTIGNAADFPAPVVAGDAPTGTLPGSPVPEPGTLALIAAGNIGVLGFGWRRRRKMRLVNAPADLASVEQ